ncbi:MAG: hypothetical protein ACREN7_02055 [Candidatus Dormibacteria bacterium]
MRALLAFGTPGSDGDVFDDLGRSAARTAGRPLVALRRLWPHG